MQTLFSFNISFDLNLALHSRCVLKGNIETYCWPQVTCWNRSEQCEDTNDNNNHMLYYQLCIQSALYNVHINIIFICTRICCKKEL